VIARKSARAVREERGNEHDGVPNPVRGPDEYPGQVSFFVNEERVAVFSPKSEPVFACAGQAGGRGRKPAAGGGAVRTGAVFGSL